MKRLLPLVWCGSLVVAYLVGQGTGPGSTAVAQQPPQGPAGALPPGLHSKISLSPDQGEPTLFTADDLRKAHTELQARAGKPAQANALQVFKPVLTRTHSYIMVHRPEIRTGSPNAEQHEGVTDVYFVTGGSGTVFVGGEIENKRISRPGEFLGAAKGGKPFKLTAGSILNIPPNMVHTTVPDPGGMTYVLMKVNVGIYPWSLINGTP
jgi:mannose-6-phosphate isomerase-like protein (cupin superfamily)